MDEDALLYGDSDVLFEGFKNKRNKTLEPKTTVNKVKGIIEIELVVVG